MMLRILLLVAIFAPSPALLGCGGGGEAKAPETFAPKPPPEQMEGEGKRSKPADSIQSDG